MDRVFEADKGEHINNFAERLFIYAQYDKDVVYGLFNDIKFPVSKDDSIEHIVDNFILNAKYNKQ